MFFTHKDCRSFKDGKGDKSSGQGSKNREDKMKKLEFLGK